MRARILIARNIRRLRVARGVTQEALAVDAGIEPGYVSRLERERLPENPSIAVLERLAKALDADIRQFFDPAGASSKVGTLSGGRKPRS
jgi:transcriptional regulator with XRE-family HTH domain